MPSRRDMNPKISDTTITAQQRRRLTFDRRFLGVIHRVLDTSKKARVNKRKPLRSGQYCIVVTDNDKYAMFAAYLISL
ncbi:hypothetical protein SCAR479_05018 [Seiridium cardinale]|uniref:Uncharacterized protein n=1 Tax=Seiridium cardinale TaxID=138064 RepID=A0ABR2Y542_9PEZI